MSTPQEINRKELLLNVVVDVLDEINGIFSTVEPHITPLDYDDAEQDLGCLADDIRTEFNL